MASRSGRFLRYQEDRRTIAFAIVFFGLVATQWTWTPTRTDVRVVLWCTTVVFAFVGAVSTHNVMHSPMFRQAWLNDVWRGVQTLWYGQPVTFFVPVHNHSHHKNVQSRRDLTRTTKVNHRWQLLNLIHGSQWQRGAKRDVEAYFRAHPASRLIRRVRQEGILLVLVYVVLLWLDWRRTLVFLWMPHLLGAFCIRAINFMQHDGCDYDAEGYDHSRNFVGGLFNWLFLNNGYHTTHHMRPGVHWSQLPALHERLVRGRIHPALEVGNAGRWLWTHILWPGRRTRFDGAPYEGQPGGEGPDLPWDTTVRRHGHVDPTLSALRRRAS